MKRLLSIVLFFLSLNLAGQNIVYSSGNIVYNGENIVYHTAGTPNQTVASYVEANRDEWTGLSLAPAGKNKVGQTFKPSNTCELSSVKFFLLKNSAPTGTITAKIYNHTGTYGTNGVPDGDAVATSTTSLDVSTITDGEFTLYTFDFAEGTTLTNNTPYCMSLEWISGDTTGGFVMTGRDDSLPSHEGTAIYTITSDGTWTADTSNDLIFYVIGTI